MMSDIEIKKLNAAKGQAKASITRIQKSIQSDEHFTLEELQVKQSHLSDAFNKYQELVIELTLLDETVDEKDDVEDRYLSVLARLQRKINSCMETPNPPTPSNVNDLAKLPSLDIPIFDGKDISNFKPFMEMFQAVVHQDSRISYIQKMCFLKKYLRGEPLQIIDSLPIIGKSYNSAIELLNKRYNNPALLTNNHINKLLDIPNLNRSSSHQLREFVANVRQHVTSLQNLDEPVQQWDSILCCILLRKLDALTVRLFHSERDATQGAKLEELLSFLDKRSITLEASPSLGEKLINKAKVSVNFTVQNNNIKCLICSKLHKLFKCPQFIQLSPLQRCELVQKHNLCKICLCHHDKKCRYNFKCSLCKSNSHNTLIHIESKNSMSDLQESKHEQVNLHISQTINSSVVLLPTAKVLVTGSNNKKYVVRALLDCGSQTSFCTNAFAQQLGLPSFKLHRNIGTLGNNQSGFSSEGINLTIESLSQDFKLKVTCSIIDKITSKLPQKQINLNNFIIPKEINLADNEFYIPGAISLLLASDVFFAIIQDGKIEGGPADPILLNTRLGYIVSSTVCNTSNTTFAMHTVSPDLDLYVHRFWEAEKIPDVYHENLPDNEYCERVFQESVSLQNNRFEVKYPLKVDLQEIDPSNTFAIALQRLYNLEKRFLKDPAYHTLYKNFINEYIELGHAKSINSKDCDPKDEPLYFLPHHGVLKLDKTTNKLRTVFDGSVKTKGGRSLNDLMHKGAVVQKSLFDILLLFRTYKYTIQCDIRHMYRMIQIHPDHRCLQNILWRENGVMKILQLQTVTYGLTSSAFLATRCLVELAQRFKDKYPLACSAVLKNSYVDDIQAGTDTHEEANQLKNELNSLMTHASFKLHKWVSNSPDLLKDIPHSSLGASCKELDQDKNIIKILGISYDARDDVFRLSGRVVTPTEIPTKRNVLSSVSRLFDPLGFAGPIVTKAKLILQELWQHSLDWDTPLPDNLKTIWNDFYTKLVSMSEIIIPRYVHTAGADEVQLIGYCDASASAYGCCIYLKVKVSGTVHVHILCSKSRLNGINSKLTIPKLELNGALLLSKLSYYVSNVLNVKNVHLFCDSRIVLSWLNTDPVKLPAYIGNRVKEIIKLTKHSTWHFTPSLFNPADIISRGSDPENIIGNSLWWHGPAYLLECDSYNFYISCVEKPMLISGNTSYEEVVCLKTVNDEPIHPFFEKYSSLYKATHVMAYILRFIKKCKGNAIECQHISLEEFREATLTIIKGIQQHYFIKELSHIGKGDDIKGTLKSLHPFIDNKGLIRVGGRLDNANLNFSKKHPIILPKHCHVTKLIIRQEHLALMHGGLKLLLSHLAQKYYIINSVREVKSVIHKCVVCCRQKAEASKQLMGSLPKDRVAPARVFEKVGIDYCGPFEIKQSTKRNSIISKGYVALFVCFACKAVHLEVVSDMTTDTFIAAFKRFISRRGIPSDVYCDNATTFKGANNQLHSLYKLHNSKNFQTTLNKFALQREIKFHFIPKFSPNHGGLWEAAVKSAKFHLKRISSLKVFTYEQFSTIMTEIEGILNSRPLISFTNQDITDFSCLTPGHFLIGRQLTAIPQPDLTEIPANRLRFWRCCEQVRQHFWKVWSKDYLSSLNERTKWRKEVPNIKCTICHKKFGYKISLQEHVSTTHERSETHTCEHCGVTYNRHRSLKRHLAVKHSKKVGQDPARENAEIYVDRTEDSSRKDDQYQLSNETVLITY